MTVMEFLVLCHEHIHAHRQRGKLGGGDSQPHAINAPQGGQPEQRWRRIAEAARLRCREAYTDDITAAALLLERA